MVIASELGILQLTPFLKIAVKFSLSGLYELQDKTPLIFCI